MDNRRNSGKNNPFILTFGRRPEVIVPRAAAEYELAEGLTAPRAAAHMHMVTGIPGTGKTVLLGRVAERLNAGGGWINSFVSGNDTDIIYSIAGSLCSEDILLRMFENTGIKTADILNEHIVSEEILGSMISCLAKRGWRLLVILDDISDAQAVLNLMHAVKTYVSEKLPIFILAAGTEEDVDFLCRADSTGMASGAMKTELKPLNTGMIASEYKTRFGLDDDTALSLARLTAGYAFAFQALGYLLYENDISSAADLRSTDTAYLDISNATSDISDAKLNVNGMKNDINAADIDTDHVYIRTDDTASTAADAVICSNSEHTGNDIDGSAESRLRHAADSRLHSSIIPQFRQYMEEFVYQKLWSRMSAMDRKLACAIARTENGKISEVRKLLGISTNQFNPYRKRLLLQGIISGDEYGHARFALPYFREFVLENYIS